MPKKECFLVILIMIFVTSCESPQQSTVTQPPKAIQTSTQIPISTRTSSPIFAPTTVITSTLEPHILQNEFIAYVGDQSINIISAAGGVPNNIYQDYTFIYYQSPSWSPSGEQIAFFSEGNGVTPRINIINKDGSGLKWLRSNVFGDPSWSPDGETIAYATSQGLFLTDVNGSGMHQLINPDTGIAFPTWSPDGKKLAFLGDLAVANRRYKIFLVNRDGTNLHPITDAIAGWSHLTWSPDGRKIAFRSPEGCGDIAVLDLITGTVTNLTNTSNIGELNPAWSPNGEYIVFSRDFLGPCTTYADEHSGQQLFIMKSNGQDITQLTYGDEPSWWPTVILRPNWKYSVTKAGSDMNIRELPSTSAKSLIKLKQGEVFQILKGPTEADGYHWWQVRSDSGIEGWCVDVPGWYMFESSD